MMRALLLAIGLAVAIFAAPPSLAQAVPAPVDAERQRLSVELATLLNNEALTRVQIAKMLNETMPAVFSANADMAALEKLYPGILRAMIDAMAPVITDNTINRLPELWQLIGGIYAETLTSEDLRAALAFYRSPTGTRVIQLMGERSDFTALLEEAAADPDSAISARSLAAGINTGATAVVGELSREQVAELLRFGLSPAGRRLRPTVARIHQLAAEWGNKPDPATEAAIEKAVTEAMTGFIAREDVK